MPKGKARPIAEDVPIWDAVIAELGDPRPYEPSVIAGSYVVPADAFTANELEREALIAEHNKDVEDALDAVEGWQELALEELDKIHPAPPATLAWRNANEETGIIPVVGTITETV